MFYLIERTQWTKYWIWQKFFCLPFVLVYYRLMLHGTIFFFCSCRVIALAYLFEKIAPVTAIVDEISLWFSAMDNSLLHASENPPVDKIEERNNFSLSHERLNLSESDDEQDDKSAAAKKSISCGNGGSRSSLSAINVSVSSTSHVVCCWIFTSSWSIPNDPRTSDNMVDWDNNSMLGIGRGDKNIYEGSFMLHNSW